MVYASQQYQHILAGTPIYHPIQGSLEYCVSSHNNSEYHASPIEYITQSQLIPLKEYNLDSACKTYNTYNSDSNNSLDYLVSIPEYHAPVRQMLLAPSRPLTPVIDNTESISHYIREAFEKTTGNSLPNNIKIQVCSANEMAKRHKELGGEWHPGILGFALNNGLKTSFIFVKENNLDELLLTIGHEIGHVITERLPDSRDEEAKAFAFELAWLKTLRENDIAGLRNNFRATIAPARNGLHDVAFSFVSGMIDLGRSAKDIFELLFRREISIKNSDILFAL